MLTKVGRFPRYELRLVIVPKARPLVIIIINVTGIVSIHRYIVPSADVSIHHVAELS